MKKNLSDKISSHPEIRSGEPCIKGTRIPVSVIVGSMAQGLTRNEILSEYQQLTEDDIAAALMYASEAVSQESIYALAS
ncbi:MAG: DUF433 domain-containing protein [Deltaproteobacteria bacterium]|nr:DUF433 domain-containing protein [Deltaproteobacteria bacterium]